MDRIRREFIKLSGYVGSLVAIAGISAGGYQALINDDTDGEDEKAANSTDSTGGEQATNQRTDHPDATENASEGSENESVGDDSPEPANESTTGNAGSPEEESTQEATMEIDDAVTTANVDPEYGDTEFSVTGEVWNVIDTTIGRVTVEVTPLDGAGSALTNEPLRDGTTELEAGDVFFFEVRSRDPAVVGNAENVELAVIAEQTTY